MSETMVNHDFVASGELGHCGRPYCGLPPYAHRQSKRAAVTGPDVEGDEALRIAREWLMNPATGPSLGEPTKIRLDSLAQAIRDYGKRERDRAMAEAQRPECECGHPFHQGKSCGVFETKRWYGTCLCLTFRPVTWAAMFGLSSSACRSRVGRGDDEQ